LWPRELIQRRWTAAHAGAGVGADEDAAGVDRALGRREHDLDRHDAVMRVLGVGLHLHDREIVGVDEPLLEAEQLRLRVEVAFVPRDVAFEQRVGELAAFERSRAEPVARPDFPREVDVGAVRRARDFDLMRDEFGVEIAVREQRGLQRRLALFVRGLIERLALRGQEMGERLAHVGLAFGVAVDADVERRDTRGFACGDVQRGDVVAAVFLEVAGHLDREIAVGLQRFFCLRDRSFVQAPRLCVADVAILVLVDLDAGDDGVLEQAVDAVDLRRDARGLRGAAREDQQRTEPARKRAGRSGRWGRWKHGRFIAELPLRSRQIDGRSRQRCRFGNRPSTPTMMRYRATT
jgi:hypothetical protein